MVTFASSQPRIRSRVMIIDDHAAIIEMMTPIVESMPGFSVVGHAMTVEQAVEVCRREHPDVVILDLVLQSDSGLGLLEAVRRVCPLVRVLVFSGNIWSATLRGVLSAGVHGVVEKMTSLAEFRTALQAVSEGRVYFSPFVSEQIKNLVERRTTTIKPPVPLSPREKAVLRYLAEGFTAKEVGALLGISSYTVANHRSNLMRKIGLRGVAQISLYAAQVGLTGETAPHTNPGSQ